MSCNRCNSGCNPCSCNSSVKYCGKELCCLDIESGDSINSAIYKIGEWVCEQNDMESTYINLVDVPSGEVCPKGGVIIQVKDSYTDAVIQEYTICNSSITTFLNNNLLGSATEINVNNLGGLQIQANNVNGRTSYSFKTYFELTYSEAQLLKSNRNIIPNCKYFITDKNIILKGLSTSEFEPRGVYVHRCPKPHFYETNSLDTLGVWTELLPTSSLQDKFVVYGARVWKNIQGNLGNINGLHELNTSDWELMPEIDEDYYQNVTLDIIYDIDNDFISEYKDNKGNTVVVSKTVLVRLGLIVSRYVCDWLQPRLESNNIQCYCINNAGLYYKEGYVAPTIISNDLCCIMNNSAENISSNEGLSLIASNVCTDIYGNNVKTIYKNRIGTISGNVVFLGGGIRDNYFADENSYSGRIENNFTTGIVSNHQVRDISDNYCPLGITENENLKFILNNKCSAIVGNVGTLTQTNDITNNSNIGGIYRNRLDNTGVSIIYNNNNGDIGSDLSTTIRSTSVSGTVVNL